MADFDPEADIGCRVAGLRLPPNWGVLTITILYSQLI